MEDIAAVKEELAEKRQALEALQRNFDDFQESSRELEDELEAELGRVSAAAVAVCRRYTRCFGVSPPRNDVRVQPARHSLLVPWNRPGVLAVLAPASRLCAQRGTVRPSCSCSQIVTTRSIAVLCLVLSPYFGSSLCLIPSLLHQNSCRTDDDGTDDYDDGGGGGGRPKIRCQS